jgi:D-serine deaminase-like pyridoxal phosphate-dependent protein
MIVFPESLDSPQLLIDLDQLDANLAAMQRFCRERGLALRVHFKSLKCGGLARYLTERGVDRFLCAKLNEAEVLADVGVRDILIANEIVGPLKLARLARLAKQTNLAVCVDDADNVAALAAAVRAEGATVNVLVEVDVGMKRCGVAPGQPALALARRVVAEPGLQFAGLQGYDGHLQMLPDVEERRAKCLDGLHLLRDTRRLLEAEGIAVSLVTGAGTGTAAFASPEDGLTEVQPGSFLLMDCAYHAVRPEYGCSLSILATVVSRSPGWYVLDAGSKAISKDFGMPTIKGRPAERVVKLAEEHTKVECDGEPPRVGDRREVIPAHCCATMNLHRRCVAVRDDAAEALWAIEASGRYD